MSELIVIAKPEAPAYFGGKNSILERRLIVPRPDSVLIKSDFMINSEEAAGTHRHRCQQQERDRQPTAPHCETELLCNRDYHFVLQST